MRNISKKPTKWFGTLIALLSFFFVGAGIVAVAGQADAQSQSPQPSAGERLITLHDTGHERGLLTNAGTLRQALEEANIPVDPNDMIEPGLDEPLVANSYEVNIYRARPVTVIDGAIRQRVMSPHQTAKQIAAHAGIVLQDEDTATLDASTDMVSEGAGIQLKIDRAVEFTFVLYVKKMTAYTQAATAAEMLAQKQISIGASDTLSVPLSTLMTKGMTIELWRNGKQTVTEEKDVPFAVEKVKDMDREVGYREVKTPGEAGKRTVIYEVDMRNGQEVSRAEIQSTVTKEPKKQIEIVGGKQTNTFSGSFAEALARLRSCEGKYTSINNRAPNPKDWYYGAYQFNDSTWGGYGGFPHASDAPASVQDEKAWLTYQRRGWQPWPTCAATQGLQDIYR